MEQPGWKDLLKEWAKALWTALVAWWTGEKKIELPVKIEPVPAEPILPEPIITLPTDPAEPSAPAPAFPYLKRALDITGKFEGKGFDQITGDFDGQGLSAGILQWNYGQGSLQNEILQPFRSRYGSIDALALFPKPGVDKTADMTKSLALQYCRQNMLVGMKVKPDWKIAWARFMGHPYVVDIQMQSAAKIAKIADELCRRWSLKSEKAFCFFFDIVTQNGSMRNVVPSIADRRKCLAYCERATSQNHALWIELIKKADDESLILFQAAYERASVANPTYFQDVFSRKGTIALGRGHVHGDVWNLPFKG